MGAQVLVLYCAVACCAPPSLLLLGLLRAERGLCATSHAHSLYIFEGLQCELLCCAVLASVGWVRAVTCLPAFTVVLTDSVCLSAWVVC